MSEQKHGVLNNTMTSIIVYSTDKKYLDRIIDEIIDTTNPSLIDEIVVCDDTGGGYVKDGVRIQTTDRVGKAKAFNLAVHNSNSKYLVFIRDKFKPSPNWLSKLIAVCSPESLVGPVVHTLDLSLWSSEPSRWRRFGWRWDLGLYDRTYSGSPNSPAVSSYCFLCYRDWFDRLGGFDDGMGMGSGEDLELSLRSWLFGGSVLVNDDANVAVALEVDYDRNTANNLARIVETWMPEYASRFYDAIGFDPKTIDTGRLSNLLKLRERQQRSIEWFLTNQQPELLGVYELRMAAAGKRVAVVGPGPSLDYITPEIVNRHDLVIGVDYVGLLYNCDFVVADAAQVVIELQKKYKEQQFIVPVALQNRALGQMMSASELVPLAAQFEYGQVASARPPFGDFDNLVLLAIQVALFMGPESITVFGCDNKIISGKSHTAKVEFYDGGRLWPDSEAMRRRFAAYEFGLDQLGRLAVAAGIPLLRVGHA